MNGAATNPDFSVVAHAAGQVKAALDATIEPVVKIMLRREGLSYS